MNDEEKFDVKLPSPVDDRHLQGTSRNSPDIAAPSTSPFLMTIQITKEISSVIGVLKGSNLDGSTLTANEDRLSACLRGLPPRHQIDATERLEPMELHPIMSVQSSRLILHRHNLLPNCPRDARTGAIDACASIGRETARVLRRCLVDPSKVQFSALIRSTEQMIVSSVSAFLCVHMWRCTLFLCYRFDFASALICARFSSIVGKARPINTACGRYLEFFLREMLAKWRAHVRFDEDEEMIAYVSGDLQGNLGHAWVWQDGIGDGVAKSVNDGPRPVIANGHTNQRDGDSDWAGWECILSTLEHLQAEVDSSRQTPPSASSVDRHSMQSPVQADSPANSTRVNIRDLI